MPRKDVGVEWTRILQMDKQGCDSDHMQTFAETGNYSSKCCIEMTVGHSEVQYNETIGESEVFEKYERSYKQTLLGSVEINGAKYCYELSW